MRRLVCPILILFMFLSTFVRAEDIFDNRDYELEPLVTNKPFDLAAELGALFTTGNRDSTSLLWKIQAKHEIVDWRFKYSLESLFKQDEIEQDGKTHTKTSAEKYLFNGEANYKFRVRESVSAYVGSEHDRFGAFKSQSIIAAGYSFRAINGSLITWDLQIFPLGFTVIEPSEAPSESAPVLRGSSSFQWTLSSHAKLSQNLSFETSKINTKLQARAAITAKIHGSMLMKVGFKATFNDDVDEGRENTDTQSSVTLVVNF